MSRKIRVMGILLLVTLLAPGSGRPVTASPPAAPAVSTWVIERVDAPKIFERMGERSLVVDAQGHLHIAYGGDFLYYAWYDGTNWQRETVDDSGSVGWDTSLALDSAGRPHISYYDASMYTVKYAHYNGSAWQIETVDAELGHGVGYTSLVLDVAGQPHISYHDYTNGDLKYAHRVELPYSGYLPLLVR